VNKNGIRTTAESNKLIMNEDKWMSHGSTNLTQIFKIFTVIFHIHMIRSPVCAYTISGTYYIHSVGCIKKFNVKNLFRRRLLLPD